MIDDVRGQVERAIASGEYSRSREGYPMNKDLQSVLRGLAYMKLEVRGDRLRPQDDRSLGLVRGLSDCWWNSPMDLLEAVAAVENAYNRLPCDPE